MADPAGAHDLYAVPLEEFVARRDDLVRRLREEGSSDDAAQVARLRKPTTDAWALNQAARQRPEAIERLIEVHQSLRDAGDADALRSASDERRRLVDEIGDAAVAALEGAGRSGSGPVRERITFTLLATASDREAEESLRRGTLHRAVDIPEVWPTTSFLARESETEDPEQAQAVERLEARAEQLAARAEELRKLANQADDALAQARGRAEQARQAAREAEEAARLADRELKTARRRG